QDTDRKLQCYCIIGISLKRVSRLPRVLLQVDNRTAQMKFPHIQSSSTILLCGAMAWSRQRFRLLLLSRTNRPQTSDCWLHESTRGSRKQVQVRQPAHVRSDLIFQKDHYMSTSIRRCGLQHYRHVLPEYRSEEH